MRCRAAKRQLYDFVDGVLAMRQAERIRSHLAGCEACREEEEAARMVLTALSAWEDASPPEDGLHRLGTRLAFLPPASEPAPAGRLRTLVLPYAAGFATAAAILLLVVPMFTGPEADTTLPDPGSEVAVEEADEPALLPGERIMQPVEYVYDDRGTLFEVPRDPTDPDERRLFERMIRQASHDR